jgi:hypothetical protein
MNNEDKFFGCRDCDCGQWPPETALFDSAEEAAQAIINVKAYTQRYVAFMVQNKGKGK